MPTPSRSGKHTECETTITVDRDFGEAMADVVRGCKVARREWDGKMRVFLQAGFLHIQIDEDIDKLKAGLHCFMVGEPDLVATDWIVVR
jgi:hypothetical protein